MISYLRQTYFFFPKVDIRCGGRSVENSPFPLNVAQPKTAVVRLRQPEESENKYLVRRELDIALDAAEGTRNLSSYVDGPDEENVPASFDKGDDGLYHVKFVPYKPGTYKVRDRRKFYPGEFGLENVFLGNANTEDQTSHCGLLELCVCLSLTFLF